MRVLQVPLVCVIGCAGAGSVRKRDAMVATLSRADRSHEVAIEGELSVGGGSLDRAALVAAVLARNPELDVARETWRAAIAGYPSAVVLPDPMVSYEVAPFSIGSSVPFGQRIEVSQKLPYPGKRSLAGDAAIADAEAAHGDYETLRLELAEATVHAFDDYYVAARTLDVNHHHHELIERIQKSATAQYTAGRASQQDPLEAKGELISLDRERLMLETQQRTAVARINRLLRRVPDTKLWLHRARRRSLDHDRRDRSLGGSVWPRIVSHRRQRRACRHRSGDRAGAGHARQL